MSNLAEANTVVEASSFEYFRAFSRNIGLVSTTEQNCLRNARVAIPGCGGVGGLHALTLARHGVGRFVIADFDTFEVENMNRQFGAKMSTLTREKVQTIRNEILEINPTADVKIFADAINEGNIEPFLDGVDIIVDSLDFFAFSARDALFPAARKLGVPLVTGAPLGFSCAMLVFTPFSMAYEEYFNFKAGNTPVMRALKFMFGLAPRGIHVRYTDRNHVDFNSGRGPSSVIAVDLCAAMVTCEVVKILLNRPGVSASPGFVQFDTYRMLLKRGKLRFGNRSPMQRLKIWYVRRFMLPKDCET